MNLISPITPPLKYNSKHTGFGESNSHSTGHYRRSLQSEGVAR